ncbi:LOW QUALITY PROTEIN: cadherin-related tumor suppressor [Drosophila tropicalis]|uniref:LOW QUALITY PROTEIN: cadherin-related tumor suppressor n=1 Tax=Drosophila tropicalis TaxID=46794 RepID=UPI0035ABF993
MRQLKRKHLCKLIDRSENISRTRKMQSHLLPTSLLLIVFALELAAGSVAALESSRIELLAPRGRSYATTYEQYAAFPPRRRSSSPNGGGSSGEMQSRAVDTSADFEVLEGQPRGTLVGFIPTKPKFTYRFNEPPREFILDPITGEVKTNAVLDREGMRDHYDLVVLSSQPTYPIEVRIQVLDINDNAPEFPEPSIAVSFSESAMAGTRLLLDAATDADTGENGVTDQYEIVDGNVDHKFRLVTTTNPSGDTSYLHLETTGNLDRESRGYYNLNISARDGGSPPRMGYLQVNVTILDVNDNPPIFDHSDYSVNLNETVQPGTPVLTVMASDSDMGDNGKLTYYLAETEHQFTVDPETGVISTTEHLNCPRTSQTSGVKIQKSCVFTVFARDHGSPRQDGRTYVTVNLLDTNDHDPIIQFQYFPPTGKTATVDENAANGTVVAAVSVIDSDDGPNGETITRLVSGNELGHFRLDKTPLFHIVRVNGVLDREEISKYNLTVVALDGGIPARSTTAHLIIDVNDVNDHEPVFEKSEYTAVLSELAPKGSFVASIAATDEDTGVNAQIHYEILSGNELKWFSMDSATGLIVTSESLDREVQDSVELSISARDGGPNPKYAYTQLKVTVLDENDEAPQFGPQQQINVTLSEDAPPQSVITTLMATDHDQGTNGSVSYQLAPNMERLYPQQFAIDSITGQLTTRHTLDRETMANYEILVIARDQGAPIPQSATATVYLSVADINDNSPEFYPKHYIYTLSSGFDSERGKSLLNVTATDLDNDKESIAYTLESGGEGLFHVDASTGSVQLLAGHGHGNNLMSHYRLTISARDAGQRRCVQDAIVHVVVRTKTEILECSVSNPSSYEFHIVEDHELKPPQLGREVGLVQVKGSALDYIILQGDKNENFAIDRKTGRLTTARPIDREAQASYQLIILASSPDFSSYGKCLVRVSVIDVNDNAPSFAQDLPSMLISVPENTAVGQEIYLPRVRDRDTGNNNRITYNLTHNPNELFRISSVTGVLYLQRPIRSEPNSILSVELMATDGGSPPLFGKLSLSIAIVDVNDHTPVFDHTSYETSLLESTKVNARFFGLAASDSDVGENARISYSIIEGNGDKVFGIFPDGYLFVRSPLDREERDYYALTVACEDAGYPSRSSQVPVVIHVLDENDNAPQFTNSTFTFSIPENAPADTFVGKLTAVDKDIGRNAELSFYLATQTQDFTIDTRNGFIKTLRSFDREALVSKMNDEDRRSGSGDGNVNYLMLDAIVRDNGQPQRFQDKVKVKVIITDVNDNAPEFLRGPYHVTLSEGSPEGTHIIHIFTQDADEGLNGDVYYSLFSGNEGGHFNLDGATGQLSLARHLDRESQDLHVLTIVARDAALVQPLSSNTTITIVVLDENDNAPEFTQSSSEVSVPETSPIGTELMRFRASDADQGLNSQVVFSITAGNRRDTFHIDSISGSLYLHKSLDYEDITRYSLNITASDCGTPSLFTTLLYNVLIVDDNDNAPVFPSTAIVRQIKEGIALKTPIVTVTADDPDSELNGKVTYAISKQEPTEERTGGGRHFGINTETGVIYTLREIDRESIDTFRLTVVATDRALPPQHQLSTAKLVTVIVEDINDNAPIFVSMNAAILPISGGNVMQVLARDADSSSNGLVTYEIVGGQHEHFQLQRNTGHITFRPPSSAAPREIRYQLALKATDEAVQSERKSSETYITIITPGNTGQDVPVFEQQDAIFGSVYENEPIGTSILTVTAHLEGTEIEYYMTNVTSEPGSSGQVDRLFDIDAKLGILSTAVELDREAGFDNYEVEVYAIALGGQPRTAHTKVKVTILDKNDSPPEFLDMPFAFNVSEDLEIGHTIATIRAHDPDTLGSITFSLVSGHNGKFLLEPTTGNLILNDTLDRETKSKYDVRIRVSDGVQYTETNIIIEVNDTNDNPPMFDETVYSFDIPENAPKGFQVGQVVATDNDLGQNGLVSYTVVSDWANDVFSLNPQTGMLTLTARLDYEEVQHYILLVQAQDNGQPSLSNTITVYCNVLDLNDNAPIFDPMSYSSEIFENAPIGMEVVTVSAKDIDSGNNGLIEYTISAGDDKNEFDISSNGTIRTRRQLDREQRGSYTLTVTARDCADEMASFNEIEETQLKLKYRSPRRYHYQLVTPQQEQQQYFLAHQKQQRLSSTVQVTILIKDVNDEAPVFVSANETSVMENVSINTVVMAVKAVDYDEGRNGYIDYSLNTDHANADSNDNDLPFSLNPTDGLLRVVNALDRELCSSYVLNITAQDRGEPPQSTTTRLLIRILDENDNSPVFDPKQYSASVAENASIGAMVLQVSATDVDEGANGRIRYSILTGDQNHDFSIGEDTGVVRVAKNLNYERKARYTLTVRAEDCAIENSASDVAELTISILDINDNRPTFLDSPYLARVMENTVPPNGGYVLTVKAYDADTPPLNSQVRYFLKEGNSDLFRINASTGEISLLKPLDRESQSEYILTLVAMDTGLPPLTGSGIVRVEVQDINDNGPVFELNSYHASIEENLPVGTVVLQPRASDRDEGLNAKLRFNLLGEHMTRFHINTDTGEITTAALLDREETDTYRLTLMAQDSSITEPRATSVNLTIKVVDVNDNVPQFDSSNYKIAVPDKMGPDRFVFGAKALDLDEGVNARIEYKLKGQDEQYFVVNEKTGVIKTKMQLVSGTVYSINIHAMDQGEMPQSSMAQLTIMQRPVELFPVYSYMAKTQFTLSEDVPPGKMIAKVSATSPKKGAIRYAIAGGNLGNAVNVDPTSGALTVGKDGLDYELAHQYEIWVEASDSDVKPSLRSVMPLTINVSDANDNPPITEKLIYNVEVLEEESPPQMIVVISASDRDSGDNGEISYRLKNDYEGTFEINEDSGEIYTTMRLDREELADYALVVEAVDQGVPQLTGTASVMIHLLDKNDNPPKFTRLFSLNVTENAELGSFVIRVTSSDLDLGANANASYTFSENPGNKFKIEPQSGNITVAGHLDREQQDEYILKVVASDGAWRAETPITITIQDQNDNAPEFEHSFYSFSFPELQHAVAFVGQIIATDRDKQGPNSVISYSLQQPSPMFSIDPGTGEIFSKKRIEYKRSHEENIYALTILATDNGKPPLYSECMIQITIVNSNNSPPKFEQAEYLSPLPEHARPGQRIVRVHATDNKKDSGSNNEIDYALVSANQSAYFGINKHDGWITLAKPLLDVLPNSRFELTVKAIDRGVPPKSDQTRVVIIVTGENRHTPEFSARRYQVIVPENVPIGSTIITVVATDPDLGPNGILRFGISGGNDRQDFSVNEQSGAIIIQHALDYDLIQEYHLNITVRDLGFKSLTDTAILTIILTDVNDNPPVFNQTEYHSYIAENKPTGTFVFQAHATDKDSPKNAIIQYAFLPSGTDRHFFSVNSSTGIISSAAIFDYEERRTYTLQLKAKNPDSTMESYATLHVHILGVNEFYPHFLQPVFHFDVSETSPIGSSVGAVQATDKDMGEDGRVYYLLVGSSNDKGFGINTNTGVLFVSRHLDRETQNRVVLTVIAKNYGSIRGNDTDEAQINISIQDGNDPPEFIKRFYTASISEATPIGSKVTTVKAIDKDVRLQNNQFSYSIINGNLNQSFRIDAHSGEIKTAALVDRESIAHYNLIIGAIDTGLPPQTGSAELTITITDVNDNGPTFSPEGLQGYIAENEPAGTSIMTLAATDPDLPHNGGPFTYYLKGGPHKSWLSVDKVTGLVKSTTSYDREATPTLEVMIEVEDSGKPPQRATHTLIINVLDQNDNPSSSRNVQVLVGIFNGELPVNIKLADIHPNDLDLVGDYNCRLQSQGQVQLIIPRACDLYSTSQTSPMDATFSYTGNDGKHGDVNSKLTVDYQHFDNLTLVNTVSIMVRNMTASQFLAHYYRSSLEMLKSRFTEDIFIYSLVDNPGNFSSLEVLLAVRSSKLNYKPSRQVIDRLREKRSTLSELLQKDVIIGYEPCNDEPGLCGNGGLCTSDFRLTDDRQSYRIIDSPTMVLSGPRIFHEYNCRCSDGFSGEQCHRRHDQCLPNPCQMQAQCRRLDNDYQCLCPANRDGKQCQRERSDVCLGKPCHNGGSCQRSPDGSSYFCLCRPGYRGNQCESAADSCRPNPCLHGGLCVSLKPGYKCSCTSGRYGRHCERFSYTFETLSFMTFPALDVTTNDLSIVFATTKPNALLLYNYGFQSGGRSDFIALELIDGRAQFLSGGARTAISSVSTGKNLSDGNWHKITATRNGRVMSLSVAKCSEDGDLCAECSPGDYNCYADTVGPVGTLNFNKQPLFIGGLASADPVLERPGQVHSDDFVGCLHSVHIAGRALNLSTPLQQNGIRAGCHRQMCQPSLASERCGEVGRCIDRWSSVLCECAGKGQLQSPDCVESLEAVTLSGGAYIEFRVSDLHRRMQLLDNFYSKNNAWSMGSGLMRQRRSHNITAASQIYESPRILSLMFRTYKAHGLILYSATNQMFTSLSLNNGKLAYFSRNHLIINMTIESEKPLNDGRWHNVSLLSESRSLRVIIDGLRVGDELDIAGVHDFLDPYLSTLSLGGGAPLMVDESKVFSGCIANFTINNELQPLNGSGSIFPEVRQHGKVELGCSRDNGIDAAQVADPLSIGFTLVIVFFVILVVAILGSYVIYRFRGKQEKIGSLSCGVPGFKIKHPGVSLPPQAQVDHVLATRNLHTTDAPAPPASDPAQHLRPSSHHLVGVGSEHLTKKFKELPPSARPDIIEREVAPPNPHPLHPGLIDHVASSVDLGSEYPEHYDLENASSIAPSDIDIVYHYKGYREAGGMRKYKATSPPSAYTHHKHQNAASQPQQHCHSPRTRAPPFVPPSQSQGVPSSASVSRSTHQSTPLARLSPSSELSSQQPRILTLHDISGKPLQSALLATTSTSSGGVGKDVLHSNSERSLNSPVMSHLSGQTGGVPPPQVAPPPTVAMGLTAEEIERLNARPRTTCSLVSTLDAHNIDVDAHSSTSTDESGNDSFTCSEIEYDNNSLSGDGKYSTSKSSILDSRSPVARALSGGEPNPRNPNSVKTPIPAHAYDGFESSFRGSLSTLVASDDDLTNHLSGIYRKANGGNGAASPSATTLGWEYLLNWGPSYENLMGVFKDIAELPDTTTTSQQQQQQSPQQAASTLPLRIPANNNTVKKAPPEEYV